MVVTVLYPLRINNNRRQRGEKPYSVHSYMSAMLLVLGARLKGPKAHVARGDVVAERIGKLDERCPWPL